MLTGLVNADFDDIARVGSYRRTHKALLEWVVHSCPGRDTKQVRSKRAVGVSHSYIPQRGVSCAACAYSSRRSPY